MRISLSAGAQVLTSLNTLTRYKTCPTVQLPYQHSRQELLLSSCRVSYYFRRLGYYSGQKNKRE